MKLFFCVAFNLFLISNIYSQGNNSTRNINFLGRYMNSNGYVLKKLTLRPDSMFLYFIEAHMQEDKYFSGHWSFIGDTLILNGSSSTYKYLIHDENTLYSAVDGQYFYLDGISGYRSKIPSSLLKIVNSFPNGDLESTRDWSSYDPYSVPLKDGWWIFYNEKGDTIKRILYSNNQIIEEK